VSSRNADSNSAHRRAIEALSDARQHVRRYRFEMERAALPADQIFIADEHPDHPQKNYHAAVMDYHEEVNQPEYLTMLNDLWQESLTNPKGETLTVEVPANSHVEKTVTETDIGDMTPSLAGIDTKQEPVSLETLGYRWSGREIVVTARVDSPYRKAETQTQSVRVWLPPKLLKAVYSQLNACLSKIGLLAKTRAPVEHDPDPI